jgi:hypothetical protein
MAAHGGAGATTLATVFGGDDIGHRWPDPTRGEPAEVLLVGRSHAAGLQAISHILDALRRGDHPRGVRLRAVIVVADAPGRTPRPLTRRIRVIGSVADVHRVPWVPAWRMGDLTEQLPRELVSLAQLLAASGGPGMSASPPPLRQP